MKRILKPAEKENAVYYSDFSGKCFGNFEPEVTLKLSFNYGSVHDMAAIEFHLSDEDSNAIIDVIKSKLSEERKVELKKIVNKQDANLQDAIDARDYTQSEYLSYSINLIKKLIQD